MVQIVTQPDPPSIAAITTAGVWSGAISIIAFLASLLVWWLAIIIPFACLIGIVNSAMGLTLAGETDNQPARKAATLGLVLSLAMPMLYLVYIISRNFLAA